jgi:hypothetical protein
VVGHTPTLRLYLNGFQVLAGGRNTQSVWEASLLDERIGYYWLIEKAVANQVLHRPVELAGVFGNYGSNALSSRKGSFTSQPDS